MLLQQPRHGRVLTLLMILPLFVLLQLTPPASMASSSNWRDQLSKMYPRLYEQLFEKQGDDIYRYRELIDLIDDYPKEYRDKLFQDEDPLEDLIEDYDEYKAWLEENQDLKPKHYSSPVTRDGVIRYLEERREQGNAKEQYDRRSRFFDSGWLTEARVELLEYFREHWAYEQSDQAPKMAMSSPLEEDSSDQDSRAFGRFSFKADFDHDHLSTPADKELYRMEETAASFEASYKWLKVNRAKDLPELTVVEFKESGIRNNDPTVKFREVLMEPILPHLPALIMLYRDSEGDPKSTEVRTHVRQLLRSLLANKLVKLAYQIWKEMLGAYLPVVETFALYPGFLPRSWLFVSLNEEPQLELIQGDKGEWPDLLGSIPAFLRLVLGKERDRKRSLTAKEVFWQSLPLHPGEEELARIDEELSAHLAQMDEVNWESLEKILASTPEADLHEAIQSLFGGSNLRGLTGRNLAAYESYKGGEQQLLGGTNAGGWYRPAASYLLTEIDYSYRDFLEEQQKYTKEGLVEAYPQVSDPTAAKDERPSLNYAANLELFARFIQVKDSILSSGCLSSTDDPVLTWQNTFMQQTDHMEPYQRRRWLDLEDAFHYVGSSEEEDETIAELLEPPSYSSSIHTILFGRPGGWAAERRLGGDAAKVAQWAHGYREAVNQRNIQRAAEFVEERGKKTDELRKQHESLLFQYRRLQRECDEFNENYYKAEEDGEESEAERDRDALVDELGACIAQLDKVQSKLEEVRRHLWDQLVGVDGLYIYYLLANRLPFDEEHYNWGDADPQAAAFLREQWAESPEVKLATAFVDQLNTMIFMSYFDINLDGYADFNDLNIYRRKVDSVDYRHWHRNRSADFYDSRRSK